MRFMMLMIPGGYAEAAPDVRPGAEAVEGMMKYNEELVKAGIMLAGDGLQPSSKGARVRFSGDKRMVIDGPFTETKELIAGFCLIEVASREEAIEWGWRCVAADGRTDGELEIRPVPTADFFGDNYTSEARDRNEDTFQKAAENLQNSST